MLELLKMVPNFRIAFFIAHTLRLQCKGAMAKIPLIVKNRFSKGDA